MNHYRLLILPVLLVAIGAAIVWQWKMNVGFVVTDVRWWVWLVQSAGRGHLKPEILHPVYWTLGTGVVFGFLIMMSVNRIRAKTISGGRKGRDLHGSADWAKWADIKRAGLVNKTGVTVGGIGRSGTIKPLRHDGPEHVICFAPTGSGKGVGLIIPTLLEWKESVMVLDIKGENHALSAGYRKSLGHNVLRFAPAEAKGSIRFNPLAEVRIGTEHVIQDCQNIATMIIDPDGKGLNDHWMKEGFAWLTTAILHVLYMIKKEEGRTANLADVFTFMSGGSSGEGEAEDEFKNLLQDMIDYDHGQKIVDEQVALGANSLKIKAFNESSGVHSTAKTPLSLYADPIVSRNISESDFRLNDLMNGPVPTALYIVIQPTDLDRLRPLIRVLMNLFLRRLTEKMEFADGRSVQGYKHRLLLLLDEFTSIGKLEIFESSLAFMRGYGLKAYIIVQDLAQLQSEKGYGRNESIISNCHIRIAYAPNKIETAKALSDMIGKTTVVQKKRSKSLTPGQLGRLSESLSETARPLMTPDEVMKLPGMTKSLTGKVRPGQMLIFAAGSPPILGRQRLYFKEKELLRRAKMPATRIAGRAAGTAAALLFFFLSSQSVIAKQITAEILYVIDGDTVIARLNSGKAEKVRITGLDAPETAAARCAEEKAAGDRATLAARRLMPSGSKVTLRLNDRRPRDTYGRILSEITLSDGRDLSAVMIAGGHARPYRRYRTGWCKRWRKE